MAVEESWFLGIIRAAAPFFVTAMALILLMEQLSYRRKKGPLPGPQLVVPFFGSIAQLIRDPTAYWDKLAARAKSSPLGLSADYFLGQFVELTHRVLANVRPDAFYFIGHPFGQILRSENVEFVVAPYEADAQLAYLTTLDADQGGIAAVVTEDSDLIAYCCPAIIFKMDRFGNGEEFTMERTLKTEKDGLSFRDFDQQLFTALAPSIARGIAEASFQGFRDPAAFDPDRFFSEERREDVAFRRNFLPFGAGAHQCVGQRYALNHLVLFMALFVSIVDFRRHATEGRDDLVYVPTIAPKDDCAVYLEQRCAELPCF
ncbi:unnamed protein product [Urochloa decumbens]|uniref:Exonuclease 1 n=1 Tax=Urochloa decumbens TaxID=240449 RepID=A0ABC8WA09_9POAL